MIRLFPGTSDGEQLVKTAGGICKALGCMILVGLRVLIPLFHLPAMMERRPIQGQRGFMLMDW